jgi:N-acetylmuramoyl-L-alanine amidase
MNLITKYMTRNDCYIANRKISPKGIMIHSTVAPGVRASAWYNRWNKSYKANEINRQVCVHAFVDDEEVWQYLPWNHRGWHAGGKANDTHIGIEICEPSGFFYSNNVLVDYDVKKNESYFRKAFDKAVDLCVLLCREYGLTEKDIISHQEGNRIGIASNHGDIGHWFPLHGEDMDSFRKAVKDKLQNEQELETAIKMLADKGVISSPNYWNQNAREGKTIKGDYAAILIKKIADILS